jgi:hypothetical protein
MARRGTDHGSARAMPPGNRWPTMTPTFRRVVAMKRTSPFAVAVAVAVAALAPPAAKPQRLDSPVALDALPDTLSGTGLFAAGTAALRPGLVAFAPQYPLWSDGATKRRWLSLPRGTFVDAARPDAFVFPAGTKLWKEFAVDGRPVETRFIERLADQSWRFATYVWSADGRDARLAPRDGIAALPLDAAGSRRYEVPSESDCRACHEGGAVPVLGFSALQLSSDRDPLAPHAEPVPPESDLRSLAARGIVRGLPQAMIATPPRVAAATPTARAALGYLHGNCGHCHGAFDESGAAVPVPVRLAQLLEPPTVDSVLSSLLGVLGRFRLAGAAGPQPVIAPGDAAGSLLPARMRSRDQRLQMPPLGTTTPDTEALALIERWIDHDLPHHQELAR